MKKENKIKIMIDTYLKKPHIWIKSPQKLAYI